MLKTPFKKRTIQCRLLNLSNVIIITYEGKNYVFDDGVDYFSVVWLV